MKFRVKNWEKFQHYKDRNPPWIKLHFSLLSSRDWVMLDDASRVLAIACMLVASRSAGEIDGSEDGLAYLQRVAYLNKPPNLKPLIACGFLESASGCKQVLADASSSVSVSVSNSDSVQEETKKVSNKKEALDLSKLPDDLSPDVWADFVRHRADLKKPIKTQTAVTRIANRLRECGAAGFSPDEVLGLAIEKGWQSIELEWLKRPNKASATPRLLTDA